METVNTAGLNESGTSSIQAEIIRQMQARDGQVPCYATAAINECDHKDCHWRSDCFEEAQGMG